MLKVDTLNNRDELCLLTWDNIILIAFREENECCSRELLLVGAPTAVKILQVAAGPRNQVSCSFAEKCDDLRANHHIPMRPMCRLHSGLELSKHLSSS